MDETKKRSSPEEEWSKLQLAWDEALDRLPDDESYLSDFTVGASFSQVEKYLSEHPDLSPEGMFFLKVSLEMKRTKGE